jgi:hypothetical protein
MLPALLKTVCRVAGVARSAADEQPPPVRLGRRGSCPPPPRPGRRAARRELLAEIRRDLAASPFIGEGHRKVWARLAQSARDPHQPQARAQADQRSGPARANPAGAPPPAAAARGHDHRRRAGALLATDATEAWTRQEGRCAVFVLVDHASNEVWSDAAKRMDRFAAADLLREVLRLGRAGGRLRARAPLRRRLLLPRSKAAAAT